MKKSLLLSLLLVASSATQAADFNYGLAQGETFSGFGTRIAGYTYTAAIEVPGEVAANIVGNQVTEVSIGFHSGVAKVANIFLTYDLDGTPFYKQEVKPLKAGIYNSFQLDSPYTIEGKKFYIGYTYRASTATGTPVGFDDSEGPGNVSFSHLGVSAVNTETAWNHTGEYGNLALHATISGDKMPVVGAVPYSLDVPKRLIPGEEFSYSLGIRNFSSQPIETVEVTATFGNGEPVVQTIKLDSPIAPGAYGRAQASGVAYDDDLKLPVSVAVTAANGEANPWAEAPVITKTVCSYTVFPRMVVAEEYTGTTCGYCPRGIYSLEILNETYPDTFIGIEAHTYSRSDPMYCSSYLNWTSRYCTGAPTMVMNRAEAFSPDGSTIIGKYREYEGLVPYKVDLSAEFADAEKTLVNLRAITYFANDVDSHNYALAFVQIENNVGPYQQYNNYSGTGVSMGGWENEGSWVTWTYNGVARNIIDWSGRTDVLPESIKGKTHNVYDTQVPFTTPLTSDINNSQFVVLLIDRQTGEIMNAGKCNIDRLSGIDTAVEDRADINLTSLSGALAIDGTFDRADIYTLAGLHTATLTGPGTVNLAPGIYAVRTITNGKAAIAKIVVR